MYFLNHVKYDYHYSVVYYNRRLLIQNMSLQIRQM